MKHYWKPCEKQLLIDLFLNTPTKVIAEKLNLSYCQVSNKAYDLGLKKSEAYLQTASSGRLQKGQRVGVATEFKKGMIPLNKGKKQSEFMSAEAIEKTKATRFKKGSIPVNIKPIGHERISKDGYLEVKVRNVSKNKNFMFKHRVVWESIYGPIPEGMIVEFIPGANKINFTINDLVLKTRKQNMISNSSSDNAIVKRFLKVREPELIEKIKQDAPELIVLKRNAMKLNFKIKEICQSKN